MFESSLPTTSPRNWRMVAVSLATQALLCAGVLLIPLLQPQRLPAEHLAVMMASLPPKPHLEPAHLKPLPQQASRQSPTLSTPQPILIVRHGGMLTHALAPAMNDAPPLLALGGGTSDTFTSGTGNGVSGFSADKTAVSVAAAPKPIKPTKPLNVSSGVIAGLLLAPMHPTYPAIAVAAHVGGTVEVSATIDKTGRIINLACVSGPAMLRAAAIDAVSAARYRPFLLNGQLTEVTTTIYVNFRLGGD